MDPVELPDLEGATAQEVVAHMVEAYHPRLYLAASFQKESSVLIDMLLKIEPSARVFTLDTGALFGETHDTWRDIEARYGITVDAYRGEWVDRQWLRDPEACCAARKVVPLERALATADGWITGLRRDQSPERAGTAKLSWDARHGKVKAAPLAGWSERDVWRYIFEHDVPYNRLHDQGYASIGCTHCTLAGSGREGRWAGSAKTECGLHVATTAD